MSAGCFGRFLRTPNAGNANNVRNCNTGNGGALNNNNANVCMKGCVVLAFRKDLTGKTYGSWKVIRYAGTNKHGYAMWDCKCNLCNETYQVVSQSLTSGRSTKCRKCSSKIWQAKDFSSSDPCHNNYSAMKQRCYDKSSPHYKDYGGRGITVCNEWRDSFQCFAKWAYDNGYKKGLTIERIDVNGDYSPSNCKFVSPEKQAANRRNTIMVNLEGETMCMSEACRKVHKCRSTVKRYADRNNLTIQEAIEHYYFNMAQ